MLIFLNGIEAEEIELYPDFLIVFDFGDDKLIGLEAAFKFDILLKRINENNYDGTIVLKLYRSNIHIDLCVFGILLLIAMRRYSVKIVFEFDYHTYFENDIKRLAGIEATVKQYLASATIVNSDLNFFISSTNYKQKRISEIVDFSTWRNTSSKFLPVLLINRNRVTELFNADYFWETKKKLIDDNIELFETFKPEAGKVNINQQLYTFLKNKLNFRGVNNPLLQFILTSYIKLLTELRSFTTIFENNKILDSHFLISQRLKENREIPFHTEIKTKKGFRRNVEYFTIIEKLNDRLQNEPAILIAIFASIARVYISEFTDQDRVKESFINDLNKGFENIYHIVKELCFGLKELFDNIIEHSTEKTGVFLCRIFDKENINEFKKDILPHIKGYIEGLNKEVPDNSILSNLFLDINLFDFSSLGILARYKERDKGDFKLADIYNRTAKTPTHSLKRLQEKIGLVLYNAQIKNLSGYFYVSTPEKESSTNYCSVEPSQEGLGKMYSNGSHYNILLPLFKKIKLPGEKLSVGYQGYTSIYNSGNELREIQKTNIWDYKYINAGGDYTANEGKIILHIQIPRLSFEQQDRKYENEKNILAELKRYVSSSVIEMIPVFDFENSGNEALNHTSFLKRFMELLSNDPGIPEIINDFIITGFNYESYSRMVEQFGYGSEWNFTNRRVLFYLKHSQYFIPVLFYGENYGHYKAINNKILKIQIGKNIPDAPDIFNAPGTPGVNACIEKLKTSNLFHSNPILLLKEFDVILKQNNITYFEMLATKCLERDINSAEGLTDTELISDVRLQGYKISDGHFKLGSKIHISDFYYAKRMFEMNEFASKYASITVNYLINDPSLEIFERIQKGLTIIGYAKYSDLLIYNIKDQLAQKFLLQDKECINVNIIQDAETPELLYKNHKIHENVLIVIPISSTFSTSFKIEKYLSEKKLFIGEFSLPVITIIDVADISAKQNGIRSSRDVDPVRDDKLFYFGWRTINYDSKSVIVESISNAVPGPREQKYFIQVFTNWYNIDDCDICFGGKDGDIKELPLVETDKASVTPQLIFGEGLRFSDKSCEPNIIIPESCHHYGHYEIDKKHNVHFIDPRKVMEDINLKSRITNWLQSLKQMEWYKNIDSNVTIITPDGIYNSEFVYVVNKELFNSKANIIKYDATTDYIANFQKFYSDNIANSDFLIYVDDQISTGTTFSTINNYIKSCRNVDGEKKFSSLITLICRSDDDTIINLRKNFLLGDTEYNSTICWFKYLRIPTVISSHLRCPICLTQDYYYELANEASLDPTKTYLLKKWKKLNYLRTLDNIDKTFHSYDSRVDENRAFTDLEETDIKIQNFFAAPYSKNHIIKLVIEDFLYKQDILKPNKITTLEDIDNLAGMINDLLKSYLVGDDRYNKVEIELLLLKVLSFTPFINHYNIRKVVFEKLYQLLDIEFNKLDPPALVRIDQLRIIKLLLKRISYLKGNYLIKKIDKLLNFYRSHEVTKETERGRYSLDSLIAEHLKNIVELLRLGENRAEWLKFLNDEKLMVRIASGYDIDNKYSHLKELIKSVIKNYETAFIIESKHLYSETVLNVLYRFRVRIIEILDKSKSITVIKEEQGQSNLWQKLIYTCRALKNLEYKRRTRSDFQYFVAHLIKEITYNNEAKAIRLDKNLTEEFDKFSEKNAEKRKMLPLPFRQLVRIIKLENTGILKKFSPKFTDLFNEKIENVSGENVDDCLLEVKNLLEDPNSAIFFQPLLNFLDQEKKDCDDKDDIFSEKASISYAHYTLLKSFLDKDNAVFLANKETSSDLFRLNQKIDYLLNRIKFILRLDEMDKPGEPGQSEIFLFVRYKPASNEAIDSTDLIFHPQTGKLAGGIDLQDSFVLNAINGLTLREHGGVQNIFEFIRDSVDDKWKSLKSYYCNKEGRTFEDSINKNSFESIPEFLLFEDTYTHLLFYRIGELVYSKQNGIDAIRNNGQAVLLVASKRKSYLKAEKLRYLTLLKESLSIFLKHHYLNDSFREYLLERQKNYDWNTYSHGVNYASGVMKRLIKEYHTDQEKKFNLELTNLIQVQFTRLKALEEIKEEPNFKDTISKEELFSIVNKMGKFIFLDYKMYRTNEQSPGNNFPDPEIRTTANFTFKFNMDLLMIIVSEIIFNFKKNSIDLKESDLFFSMDILKRGEEYFLLIKNNYAKEGEAELEKRLQEMYDKTNRNLIPHGTKMIETIYKNFFNRNDYESTPVEDTESAYYLNCLPIFNYKTL